MIDIDLIIIFMILNNKRYISAIIFLALEVEYSIFRLVNSLPKTPFIRNPIKSHHPQPPPHPQARDTSHYPLVVVIVVVKQIFWKNKSHILFLFFWWWDSNPEHADGFH